MNVNVMYHITKGNVNVRLLTAETDLSLWMKQGAAVTSYAGGRMCVEVPLFCVRRIIASKTSDFADDKCKYLI